MLQAIHLISVETRAAFSIVERLLPPSTPIIVLGICNDLRTMITKFQNPCLAVLVDI